MKPNKSLPDLENFPLYMILEEPEFGVTYKNGVGEKYFLRFREVASYSDGTLKAIKLQLRSKLDVDKKEKVKMDVKEKELILKAMDTIEDRIQYRNAIRRFEVRFGLRKKFGQPVRYLSTLIQRGRLLGLICSCIKVQGLTL